jgi:DNA processing protein
MTSKGTNKLIKQGAKLAQSVGDILEDLNLSNSRSCQDGNSWSWIGSSALDKDESLVYTLLSSDPKHVDDICMESGIGLNRIAKILLSLEIKKFAKQLPGKNFVKI